MEMQMENQNLIAKIQTLKNIKPKKDWANLVKSQILSQELALRKSKTELAPFFLFSFEFLRTKFSRLRPALLRPAFVTTAMMILLITGLVFYFVRTPSEIAEAPADPAQPAEIGQVQIIVSGLEEVRAQVAQATESLKRIKEPQKILEARNVVVPVIEAVRAVVDETEKLEKLEQPHENRENPVLAVKFEVGELENTLQEMTALEAKNLIEYFKTRTLTETQQSILEKAKQDYAAGNYTQASINGLFIGQAAR